MRLKVIGADRQDFERGHVAAQIRGRFDQALLGNIDRNIGDRILESFEQHARFHSGAGAETDQLRVGAN